MTTLQMIFPSADRSKLSKVILGHFPWLVSSGNHAKKWLEGGKICPKKGPRDHISMYHRFTHLGKVRLIIERLFNNKVSNLELRKLCCPCQNSGSVYQRRRKKSRKNSRSCSLYTSGPTGADFVNAEEIWCVSKTQVAQLVPASRSADCRV